jgi:chitodextrinase
VPRRGSEHVRRQSLASAMVVVCALFAIAAAVATGATRGRPPRPAHLHVVTKTKTAVVVAWRAPSRARLSYRVYRNGHLVRIVGSRRAKLARLRCNSGYDVAVLSVDSAGRRSRAASVRVRTRAYAVKTGAGTAPSTDTTPPSTVSRLAVQSVSASSITLAWPAANDNVGVVGYGIYRDCALVASTASTQYTVAGLGCGTAYRFAVDAYDAGGNRSAPTELGVATSACAAGGGGGGGSGGGGGGGGGNTGPNVANLWVDRSGGTCARQATAGPYVDGQACGSLDAAYQASAAGDVVRIKAGDYGDQTIDAKSGTGAPNRVFEPASGEAVRLHDVTEEDADYITLQGPMTLHRLDLTATLGAVVDGLTIAYGYSDTNDPVVFIGGKATGGRANDGVVIRNSDISGAWDQKNVLIDDNGGSVTNVVLDHDDIHSQKQSDDTVHMECIWITDADGVTIRNSRVWGCHSTGDVIISNSDGGPGASHILFENDVFETAFGAGTDECCNPVGYTIQTGVGPANTWTFQYNVLERGIIYQPGMTVRGNVGVGGSCPGNVTFASNLWTDVDCGSDTKNPNALGPGQFVNSAQHNWRPAGPGSAQVDKGDPGSYPASDADGARRYTGAAPDAGPYELH